MLIEHRTYTIAEGRVPEFLDLVQERGWAALTEALGECLGFYWDEDQSKVTHLWRYLNHADHEARLARLLADERFQAYAAIVEERGLMEHIDARWLRPASFSP
jgi:hypothetical protein